VSAIASAVGKNTKHCLTMNYDTPQVITLWLLLTYALPHLENKRSGIKKIDKMALLAGLLIAIL
jgi:hypothetical protein